LFKWTKNSWLFARSSLILANYFMPLSKALCTRYIGMLMNKNQLVDVFFEVFKDVRFPLLSADFGLLGEALRQLDKEAPLSHFAFPVVTSSDSKRDYLIASLRGIFRQIDIPDQLLDMLSKTPSIENKGYSNLLVKSSPRGGEFAVYENNDQLVWEEESLWPIAFSTILTQLINILYLHCSLIELKISETTKSLNNKGFSSKNIDTLSEYPRQLPTHLHYAFASLGAWIGGSMNVQYFAYYAAIRQIHHSSLNMKYASRIGFSEQEAKELTASGIIVLPFSLVAPLLKAQDCSTIFGSLPIDETNIANQPNKLFFDTKKSESDEFLPGLVVDKYYRAPYFARKPESYAFYGHKNVMRDQYSDFYDELDPCSLVRCKHYCAPVIEVSSIEEIRKYIKMIPKRHDEGVFFRGQRRMHLIKREPSIQKVLFGDSCCTEPSLITSAARDTEYDYDDAHFILKHHLEQKIIKQEENRSLLDEWREKSKSPDCKLDSAIVALAQHYGLPSHGLDITTNDDVALWFATNIYSSDDGAGISTYRTMTAGDWPKAPEEWPVIIVCQAVTNSIQSSLHDCEELEEFGFKAQRPNAQHARFFKGGHSDHQNRLAETVVCVFRLAPNTYETECDFNSLFPSPDDDPAYKTMLEFACLPEYKSKFGKYINRFHKV
jgi:hypothetical protein